jgi:hypothetical protein
LPHILPAWARSLAAAGARKKTEEHLWQRRQDAETRKEQIPSFLRVFNNFVPGARDEMLFLFGQL